MLPTEYLRAVARSWWLIVLCMLLGVAASVLLMRGGPSTYTASSSVLLSPSRAAAASSGDAYTANLLAQGRATTYGALATSSAVVDDVVERLGSEVTATRMRTGLEASVPTNSAVITLTYSDTDRERAREVAQQAAKSLVSLVETNETGGASKLRARVAVEAALPTAADPVPEWRSPLLGVAAGLALGLGLSVTRWRWSRRPHDVADIAQSVGAPFVTNLPTRRGRLSGNDWGDAIAELRTRIFVRKQQSGTCLRLTVTSPSALPVHDLVTSLAAALAGAQIRVLVIHTDPGAEAGTVGPGLAYYLTGSGTEHELIHRDDRRGFDVIHAGADAAHLDDLLHSPRMTGLLEGAAADHDVVLLVAPPMDQGTQALVLAAQSHGVLLCVPRRGVTTSELERSRERLRAVDASVVGLVAMR